MSDQPEVPIDPPAASADEKHRDTCFEDLLLCIREITPLAAKLAVDDRDGVATIDAVDFTMCTAVELLAALLENSVTSWREAS